MGKVECPIRLYGVQNKGVQGGVGGGGGSHQTAYTGDCWSHVFSPAHLVLIASAKILGHEGGMGN